MIAQSSQRSYEWVKIVRKGASLSRGIWVKNKIGLKKVGAVTAYWPECCTFK